MKSLETEDKEKKMKNFLSIFQAACILKRCLFAVVLVICSHLSLGATDDLMKAENYYPGAKYSVFGGEFFSSEHEEFS